MILSAQTILDLCTFSSMTPMPMITPFIAHQEIVNGRTYGLGAASYDVRIAQEAILYPADFRLVNTIENFCMPDDVAAQVLDKSSLARRGISAFNTWLDPGWRGNLTLELVNQGPNCVKLAAGDPVVQIVFWRLDRATSRPYQGKYSDQPREWSGSL